MTLPEETLPEETLPALLLHGFTGAGVSWRPVVDALPGWELRCPDLLGHGADGVEADSFEAEVDRLVAEMPPGPFVVAGYSLGARLALAALVRHAGRVRAGLLIGGHPGLTNLDERAARRSADAGRARALRERGVEAFVDEWERLPLFATQRSLPSARLAEQRALRLRHDAEGLARSLEVLGLGAMPGYATELESVSQPVQLLVGERDDKFSRLAERSAAALPDVRLDRVPGVGHNVLLERPDAVVAALATCLATGTHDGPPIS